MEHGAGQQAGYAAVERETFNRVMRHSVAPFMCYGCLVM